MIIHIYTCECGEQFRSRNKAHAFELVQEHRDDADRGIRFTHSAQHTTVETPDVIPSEPLWSPAQGDW